MFASKIFSIIILFSKLIEYKLFNREALNSILAFLLTITSFCLNSIVQFLLIIFCTEIIFIVNVGIYKQLLSIILVLLYIKDILLIPIELVTELLP